MSRFLFNMASSTVYCVLLIIVYSFEISVNWAYMGFDPISSVFSLSISAALVLILAALLPTTFDTRGFLLAIVHFGFFIPSLVILSTIQTSGEYHYYLASLLIFWGLLSICSAIPMRRVGFTKLTQRSFLAVVLFSLFFCDLLIASFGGLSTFNLNPIRVYEFRSEAAESLPAIFGYFVSGVSKVVAPLCLTFAILFRSWAFVFLSVFLVILLFGMTQHKSVLLLPVTVALFFYIFNSTSDLKFIGIIFIGVSAISTLELAYLNLFEVETIPYFNAFITRRALFVPPLLDTLHISFFSQGQYLLWSTSKLGLDLAQNPYDITAPFLIGREYFGNASMSANTGIIGSGFSHAGLIGVTIYSTLAGFLVALFQVYGRSIGHALVSVATFSVFMSIVSSTDFATAILTHGLMLLIILLLFFPTKERSRKAVD